ncbi:ROK family protein [Streptomyces sp. NPDC058718]|uniref:ROK family transcriptional regulator n=1 Tax=Streptomyces sp. NPDC058718 TaxID=3346610 RepID=UPI0036B6257E
MNDEAALAVLVRRGRATAGELSSELGLSRPTSYALLSRLEAAGLVVETGRRGGRTGPRARMYELAPGLSRIVGIELSSSRITVAVADLAEQPLATASWPLHEREPEAVARLAGALVRRLSGSLPAGAHAVRHAVVGLEGVLDPETNGVTSAAVPEWEKPRFREVLARELRSEVTFARVTELAAIAENTEGVARGADSCVLFTAGDRMAVGVVVSVGGAVRVGARGYAGDVSRLPHPSAVADGSAAPADWGGAVSVLRNARQLGLVGGGGVARDALALLEGEGVGRGGAPGALVRRYGAEVAAGLAPVAVILDPEIVVLSGPLCAAGGEVLRDEVERNLRDFLPSVPRVLLSRLGDQAVLRGALHVGRSHARDSVYETARVYALSSGP